MYSHGIMFHYFYGDGVGYTQGSLNENDIIEVIDKYICRNKYNLLSAEEYIKKVENSALNDGDVCFTIDDGLKCAYQVAYPVMRRLGITGFWFVYTSPYTNEADDLEKYRLFRNTCYENIAEFYEDFSGYIIKIDRALNRVWNSDEAVNYKRHIKYYDDDDRRFRYMRDKILNKPMFELLMGEMMNEKGFDFEKEIKDSHISEEELKRICDSGNIVGLHSHTHPTLITELSATQKEFEYSRNKEILCKIIGKNIKCVAYPDGAVDDESIEILKRMSICMGFIEHMEDSESRYKIPRIDSADIMRMIR